MVSVAVEFQGKIYKLSYQKPSLLDDLNKERIKFNIEIIKLLTLLFITTGGGGLALLVEGSTSPSRWILGMTGALFAAGSGALAIFVYRNTVKKLQNDSP